MSTRRTEPTLAPAAPPLGHLMALYQRFDSLRNSIALLREQTLHTPGIEDWPSVLTHYTNLLSHAYSIASALQSPAPHFLTAQMATIDEFLDNEAQDANLFGEEEPSSLFGTGEGATLPPIEARDKESMLPRLAVHPAASIPDNKLNWLGTLLSTVPDLDASSAADANVAAYDAEHPGADEASLAAEHATHDARSLGTLRKWYHVLHAPDNNGDTYDFVMRIEDEE